MKNNFASSRSSMLVSLPVMLFNLVLCVLAAFFGQTILASAFVFLFLMALISRLWALAAGRRISVSVTTPTGGLFPGDDLELEVTVRNDKFLPVIWLDLFTPLARNLCLIPEVTRPADNWEIADLRENGMSEQLVGEKRFSFLLWYETVRFTLRWRAQCRGLYSMEHWRLRTGDGLGLTQVENTLPQESMWQFAVYPRLIDVSPELFLRNLWNADTGSRGVMEDLTVIRSTRDYQVSDSFKHINWRLAARALPLTVNVYEDILPKNVHFIFDGESFSGPTTHPEEMEDALSILASEFVRLAEHQVQCGLSLCQGQGAPARNLFASDSIEELLRALAGYQPMDPVLNENGKCVPQAPVFDAEPIQEAMQKVGRFYYISYDTDCLYDRTLLLQMEPSETSLLTYQAPKPFGEFEVIDLSSLKDGLGHE